MPSRKVVESRVRLRSRLRIAGILRDAEDNASWSEFAEIYTPLLYGFCMKRGLAHADAADVVQDVMHSVARAMRGFEYDPRKGSFKGWLFTATRNAMSRHFRREARQPLTPGETQVMNAIDAGPDEGEQRDWERDYQRQLLGWAMEAIRPDYGHHVWKAFVETALRDREPADVAAELGMTPNAVAVAKYRIVKRLKAKAESVDAERWEEDVIARSRRS